MADDLLTTEIVVFWRIGFSISTICLLTQILIYIVSPSSRKLDLQILTQITISRLAVVGFEYLLSTPPGLEGWVLNACLALYIHGDCASICWMFTFSKNLYDKVTKVFATKKTSLVAMLLSIWLLTLPVGLLCPSLLYVNPEYFDVFYKVYAILKFIVLLCNLLFFCRIFYVAIDRKFSKNFKLLDVVKICVMSFILVTISSVQVLLGDLLAFFEQESSVLVFCVINSYQVVVVMVIFLILAQGMRRKAAHNTTSRGQYSVSNSAV